MGHDESALHNPAELTGFSPSDLLEHAFASPVVDFEGTLYWLILSGAITRWFATPVLALHCRNLVQTGDAPSSVQTGNLDPVQMASHAALAYAAALEVTSEPCDQLHVLLVCLVALRQQCPPVSGEDTGKGVPLLEWLQQQFTTIQGPVWLHNPQLDLQADLQSIERLASDQQGELYSV